MSERGKLLVFEGVDGSGKSCQAELLCKWMTRRGIMSVLTEEHWRDDILGQAIEAVVEKHGAELNSTALQLTFIGNRVDHTMRFIKSSLEHGVHVVSDRYLESTINYADDKDRKVMMQITNLLVREGKILRPDLTLLIDVPAEVAMERLEARRLGRIGGGSQFYVETKLDKKNMQSIFEKKEKLGRVRQNYLERFTGKRRMVIIDGVGTVEEVNMRVMGEIQRRKII